VGELRRNFGFWNSVGRMQFRDLLAPEILLGLVFGVAGSWALIHFGDLDKRFAVAGDYLQLAAALVGVVFAGFALVITLMSDEYLRWLETSNSGVEGFLRPFLISTGLQVGAVVGAVFYRAAAKLLPAVAENLVFVAISVLFVVAAFDVVSLARSVLMHGVAKARGVKIKDLQSERSRRASERGAS